MPPKDNSSRRAGYAMLVLAALALVAFVVWSVLRDSPDEHTVPVSYDPSTAAAPQNTVPHAPQGAVKTPESTDQPDVSTGDEDAGE